MKMINTTRRQSSLSLSGGHIISDNYTDKLAIPTYSPNAHTPNQPFPWDETVDDINTPDIDPSFFDNGPLFNTKKLASTQNSLTMDLIEATEENFLFATNEPTFAVNEDKQQSIDNSLEENYDFSALINDQSSNQFTDNSQSLVVSPNDVLENQFIPSSTTPVLHYLEPRPVETVASTVEYITTPTLIESLSQSTVDFPQYSVSSPQQSYSSAMSTVSHSYLSPSPSPALSYTSTSTLVSNIDAITSDTTQTVDSLIDIKPEPEFLQPTVINDHLYTCSRPNERKRKSSSDKSREKNNTASKKSRTSKRDKQREMEEQIRKYTEDNEKCRRDIDRMEKEIAWCKDYLFKKVTRS